MIKTLDTLITPAARDFLSKKYSSKSMVVSPVKGGYSLNRRSVVDVGSESLFVKEVDTSLLTGDGRAELGWLKKDYELVNELAWLGISVAPDWAELCMDGHLLIIPSYKKESGWWWSLPEDEALRFKYVQAVVDATKQLETAVLPEDLTGKLSLQPYFSDKIAHDDGIDNIINDKMLKQRLIQKYTKLQEKNDHLLLAYRQMVATLSNDGDLRSLQKQAAQLANLPSDCLNHCDVRSDNIAYNERTGVVKFVDWNWTSYAPAKFGATEFLIDMARHGVNVKPWRGDLCIELLAAIIGYYMIRSLKYPLSPGSTLREMQTESAAVANYLYKQIN